MKTNTNKRVATLGICSLVIILGLVGEARADYLEHCNGIYLEADAAASCKVVPTKECEVKCEPVATENVCASRLTTSCDSNCTVEADVECRSGCKNTCVPNCTAQEGKQQPPNCRGLCMSDCQKDCNEKCEGGHCRCQCAQICSKDCRDKCDSEPEPVCEPLCETACWGSCQGRVNVDCQLSCQSETFTECETTVTQECKKDCKTTGAAIFCDGQFLASADDLEACAEDIDAEFAIHLDVNIEANVSVNSNAAVDGKASDGSKDTNVSLGCSIAPNSSRPRSDIGLMTLFLVVGACWRLRRFSRAGARRRRI
jgi:hypothetical protein